MDWRSHKAVAFVSDDWGMFAWTPDMAAFEALEPCGFFTPVWSCGTLERPGDMQRLFDVLLSHRGGDGRPVVFQPCYIAANPDFAEIEKSGFAKYIDRALGSDVPARWQRGDFIAKALEGRALGIWQPEYHCRCHHFSGARWVQRLREGDKVARAAWDEGVYVCEKTRDRLGQYEGMSGDKLDRFIEGGFEMFRETFGCRPNVALTSDWVPGVVRAMGECGAKAVELVEGAEKEGVKGTDVLEVPTRNASFEPLGHTDEEVAGIVDGTLVEMEENWARGLPAMVSSHRTNYVSLDAKVIDRNFALFEELLERLLADHADVVFLTGWETAQLHARGTSSIRFGNRIVVRNYTGGQAEIPIELPRGESIKTVTRLRSGAGVPCETQAMQLNLCEGEYAVDLAGEGA